MNKLRLLITRDCARRCRGCCNKDYDLESLPVCNSYIGYDEIILTGGEPMLYPDRVSNIIDDIRKQNASCKIILYTADVSDRQKVIELLYHLNGITVTLHTNKDIESFLQFNCNISAFFFIKRSMRLNIFKGVKYPTFQDRWESYLGGWDVKRNVRWIKNCPLPKDEVFMRLL